MRGDIKPLTKGMDKLMASGHERRRLFDDWLDMMIYLFSLQKYEDRYAKVIEGYTKEELMEFSGMFAWLVKFLDENQFEDPLGEYFEDSITHGERGQFFTPTHVSRMMAAIANPVGGESVNDPTCGSGRMLLAALESSRKAGHRDPYCFGADLDRTCVKMTVVNLSLYGVMGEIACMNSLSNEFYGAYKLMPPLSGGLTIIEAKEDCAQWKATENMFQKKREDREEPKPKPEPKAKPVEVKAQKPPEPVIIPTPDPKKVLELFQESLF